MHDYLQNFRFVPQSDFDGITVGFNWFLSTACLNQSTYFVRETEECEGFLIIDTGERHSVFFYFLMWTYCHKGFTVRNKKEIWPC